MTAAAGTPPFAQRRARVAAALGADAALILAAAPELLVGDTELRYLPDPDLYYLTGYSEPEAVLVVCPAHPHPFTLFVRPRDPQRELWSGARGGVEAARDAFGADCAHPIAELADKLPTIVADIATVYARLETGQPVLDGVLRTVFARARHGRPRSGTGPHTLRDPDMLLGPMRLIKDETEIARIRQAADITVRGFRAARRAVRPGTGEWAVEARLEAAFRDAGAFGPAFPSIVAGGPNAAVLHYISNDAVLCDGHAVLIDAGARYDMYAADVTRTYPVGQRFSTAQSALYDIVLAAHQAGIAAALPGATVDAVHDAALRVLVQGLLDLDCLHGSVEEAIETKAYKPCYPHRTSHWLGLATHDAGPYTDDARAPRTLAPGMVLTVEPGLYVPAHLDSAPAALRGIGIRLEDDVLITVAGHEVLTAALPIGLDDVQIG